MTHIAASKVYYTLTADLGIEHRNATDQADNVLDLDGLLHVEDVIAFIDALREWQVAVLRGQGSRRGRQQLREELLSKVRA